MQAVLQQLDAQADEPAVGLELRLARAAHADAAAELLEVGPQVGQARQRVLELRELHLHPGLGAPRAHGEDVEDQLGPVDHAAAELELEVLPLRGAELVVEDEHGRVLLLGEELQLVELALAHVGGGIGTVDVLRELADDDGAGGVGQALELARGARSRDGGRCSA